MDVARFRIAATNEIPPMKTTLATVLRKVLARLPVHSGAIWVIRHDGLEITTKAAWLRELGLPPGTKSELVSHRFRGVPLHQALEAVGPVLIDLRVEKQVRTKVTARLTHVPIETVVELLADMADLAVVKRGDVFYVTSRANAVRLKQAEAERAKETFPPPRCSITAGERCDPREGTSPWARPCMRWPTRQRSTS